MLKKNNKLCELKEKPLKKKRKRGVITCLGIRLAIGGKGLCCSCGLRGSLSEPHQHLLGELLTQTRRITRRGGQALEHMRHRL